jgi:hypothetical protein
MLVVVELAIFVHPEAEEKQEQVLRVVMALEEVVLLI